MSPWMTVAVAPMGAGEQGEEKSPRKRLSLLNAPFCTLMASLAANCFIWQQIDREEDRLPITGCVVAERLKRGVNAEQLPSDDVMVSIMAK